MYFRFTNRNQHFSKPESHKFPAINIVAISILARYLAVPKIKLLPYYKLKKQA